MGNCWQRPDKKQEFFRNPSGIAGWAQVYEQKDRIIFTKNPDRSRIKKISQSISGIFFSITPSPPAHFFSTRPYRTSPSPHPGENDLLLDNYPTVG